MTAKLLLIATCIVLTFTSFAVAVEEKSGSPDPVYSQLRSLSIAGDGVSVSHLVIKRDIGTFTFNAGSFYFAAPVEGKITGAVFIGDGTFAVAPVLGSEKRNMAYLTKGQQMSEAFSQAVFRFTDATADEIKKAGTPAAGGDVSQANKVLAHNIENLRSDRVMRYNLSARIAQDLLAGSGGLFFAFVQGKNYSSRDVFAIDPQGVRAFGIEPEEVAFATVSENKFGVWVAEHLASEYANGKANGTQQNAPIDVTSQRLELDIARNGEIRGVARTTVKALRPGIRVLPFTLFRSLRVESVVGNDDNKLPFILEEVSWNDSDPGEDDNFNVILSKPLQLGESITIQTTYGGKHAVTNEGDGNYYPVARSDWYPSVRGGDFSEFDMTFRIPKDLKITATGVPVKDTVQDKVLISQWRSEGAIPNAGFNFGRFKSIEQKVGDGITIVSLANEERPDWVKQIQNEAEGHAVALGTMDTTTMMKKPLGEAQMSVQLYNDYYGPSRFKRIAMTQQTACTYGQSWPQLVWMPICSFYDSTILHQFGLDDTREQYWKVVAAHEVAHQWFGDTVGWASYRDQWISEGFANASASIYMQAVYKDQEMFRGFYKSLQEELVLKNRFGFRAIDIGPVTMGHRLGNDRVGYNPYRALAYGKGAYILHMIRMMMWDRTNKDQRFKELMRDFVSTYNARPASTEDFQAMVEKHMTPDMDIEGNHRMNWFFNEYVYGTEIPKYDLESSIGNDANGTYVDMKLTQSGVSDNFKMIVPLYLDFGKNRVIRLTTGVVTGNKTVSTRMNLGKLQDAPKRLLVNYNYDVLAQ